MAKVMHLKQENSLGANLVAQHMLNHCNLVSGPKNELIPEMDKACLEH